MTMIMVMTHEEETMDDDKMTHEEETMMEKTHEEETMMEKTMMETPEDIYVDLEHEITGGTVTEMEIEHEF